MITFKSEAELKKQSVESYIRTTCGIALEHLEPPVLFMRFSIILCIKF